MTSSSPALDIVVLDRGVAAVAVERLRIPLRGLVEVRDAGASVGSLLPSFGTDEPARELTQPVSVAEEVEG